MNIQVFRKTKFVHFSIIIAATVCLYGNTFNLGFFSDDFLGIARYEKMGFGGLSNNYDNPFYMPFSFLFQALEISLTKSYLVIKTINLSLFISTAILIYSLTSRVFTLTKTSENTGRTALIITLLFVCSPYQTEAVNWFSSQAYLLSTFFAILGLHFLLKNSKRKNTGFYYYFLFLFLALLNKEISLILPIIAFLLRFLQTKDERVKFQHFVLGNILVLLVYFILRFIYLDALVGGYGTEAHLNTAPAVLSYGVIAYTAKFFFFYRYLPQ